MTGVPPLIGTRTFVGRNGHIILFTAGWLALPPRARKYYMAATVSMIGGFFTIRISDTPGGEPDNFWEEWHPTIWSYLLWAFAVWALYKLFVTARQERREEYAMARNVQRVRELEAQEAELLEQIAEVLEQMDALKQHEAQAATGVRRDGIAPEKPETDKPEEPDNHNKENTP